MNVVLLVTLLATVSFPQGTPEPRPVAPAAAPAPDTLAGLDTFGSLGTLSPPGSTGKDLFSGFS